MVVVGLGRSMARIQKRHNLSSRRWYLKMCYSVTFALLPMLSLGRLVFFTELALIEY